ncbi:MAG: DUF4058 family protein [Chloroflexi bacterium]|nr:DUF4058 family protein [Chloroflexota bacterium]
MPSPFPGMDPYLEEPSSWGGFHSRFINSVSDTIADAVSPNFLVNIEERVFIVPLDNPERPYEAWLFDLRDTLPTIAIPLRPPFEDVPLTLQSIFNTVYSRGHYAEALDYSGSPPLPRLRPADTAWAKGLLALTPPLSPE